MSFYILLRSIYSLSYRWDFIDIPYGKTTGKRIYTWHVLNGVTPSIALKVSTEPENSGIQVNARMEPRYKIITWDIDRAIMAPRLGIDLRQMWPYDPYHEVIMILSYAGRALVLFLCLAVLTLLICNAPVHLWQLALLSALFALPFLQLMTGDLFRPLSVTPTQFTDWQIKALPALSMLPLTLAFVILRKLPRLPLSLILLTMAAFMSGYVLIGLLPDEQKRNAAESVTQAGMIIYVVVLALFTRVRSTPRTES